MRDISERECLFFLYKNKEYSLYKIRRWEHDGNSAQLLLCTRIVEPLNANMYNVHKNMRLNLCRMG